MKIRGSIQLSYRANLVEGASMARKSLYISAPIQKLFLPRPTATCCLGS